MRPRTTLDKVCGAIMSGALQDAGCSVCPSPHGDVIIPRHKGPPVRLCLRCHLEGQKLRQQTAESAQRWTVAS
jgi:hypothetical protein